MIRRQPALMPLRDVAGRLLQRAEVAAERKLCFIGEGLVMKDQHTILVHSRRDRSGIGM